MASDKPVAAVIGATGAQGGGVVNALQGKYSVRAITRDTGSDAAKALADRGLEVVRADLLDRASLDQAFANADAVFVVTDFYRGAGGRAETESQMGKNAVDAAKQAGVKHLVWSGLEDPRQFPDVKAALPEVEAGHIVPHFESKADVTEYLKASGVPYTVLLTCAFYDNHSKNIIPYIRQDDGSFAFHLNSGADNKLALHAVADIGATTAVVLADPRKYLGKTVPVVGDLISSNEIAQTVSDVTGKTLKFVNVPDEAMAGMGFPGAAEMANMWHYYRTFPYYNDLRPLDQAAYCGPSFRDWAEQNKDALTAKLQ